MATTPRRAAGSKKSTSSSSAQVTLNGRFPAGELVRLVEAPSDVALRSEGGREVATATVDENGRVQFKSGVKAGQRYFIVGQIGGAPVEVRVRGNKASDDNAVLAQAPVGYDDPPAVRSRPAEDSEPFGQRLAQEQVGDGVQQRSATATGTAHPVDPGEAGPYPSQEDKAFSSGKTQQRSDTELGQATPIPDVPGRQQDVPADVAQRSSTPLGVATPLPPGDAVDAVRGIESAEAKAAAGEPAQADARGVVPGEVIASDGERHEDAVDGDYAPVAAGADPAEGLPESERPAAAPKRASKPRSRGKARPSAARKAADAAAAKRSAAAKKAAATRRRNAAK